ncbi:MAG: 16S rRNA methyltransferase [Clostridiales bacterium]|nr:MAG: 16S rRNA methyltransferase [Clostridiales bacterium]
MAHYYDDHLAENYQTRQIEHVIGGRKLVFVTADGVFAKAKIDFGSHFLIDTVLAELAELSDLRMLDIGCGYGAIGIALAIFKPTLVVTMIDVNSRALALAKKNIAHHQLTKRVTAQHLDSYRDQAAYYDVVVSNPPIRAGKTTVFGIYDRALSSLKQGGTLYIVIQKKQGAASSKKYLSELFGNCSTVAKKSGYYILKSVKNKL